MNAFIEKHKDLITGTISVFDRLIIKGYLPFSYPQAAEHFLSSQHLLVKDFRDFVSQHSAEIADHARALATRRGRPYEYLNTGDDRKEDLALKIARRDGITRGLVCVFGITESNSSFSLRVGKNRPHLVFSAPRCLTFYFYFIDRDFGLMHIRISSWFPYPIQIYLNGHEWLARRLTQKNISFQLVDNAFTEISDCEAAQEISDEFVHRPWEKILRTFAKTVNPLMKTIVEGFDYYWVCDQAEYATDVMFKSKTALSDLYTRLQRHVAVCTQAEDIMGFLGKKLHSLFGQEISTSTNRREPGLRVKHRVGKNWIKMYDKFGGVLRIETVINDPRMFMIRRMGKRQGLEVMGYYPMPKRVTCLYRYAEIGRSANNHYLEMLAAVDNPTESFTAIRKVCEPANLNGKRKRAMNPLKKDDITLFAAVMKGEWAIQGFRHKDVAKGLGISLHSNPQKSRSLSARVSRKIQLLRAHGLICKIPRSRRYRITELGTKIMAAALHLREVYLPDLMLANAA